MTQRQTETKRRRRYRLWDLQQDQWRVENGAQLTAAVMTMKPIALAVLLSASMGKSLASGPSACSGGPAQVMVLPSVHKLLERNPAYSYRRLYTIVAAFRPDRVGVEIRQEDLARPVDYLARNYPKEMVALAARYGHRVFGFDWLGDELRGIPVPDDWWAKRSPVKRLERAWAALPTPNDRRIRQLASELEALSARRDALERTASPEALADGSYDKVTADYYAIAARLTRDTPYAAFPHWYAARDRHLADGVVEEVRHHPGCRIAVVTGADHHGAVVAAIGKLPGDTILEPVP